MKPTAIALVLVAACAAAAVPAVTASRAAEWPGEPDLVRDIAMAETIASGHPLSDPFYRGEWLWYSPLVPAVVAAIGWATDVPVRVVYLRAGAYLNLLVPIAVFACAAALFEASTAVTAALAFLFFVPGHEPSWLTVAYSPWLVPDHFAMVPFFVSLWLIARAWSAPSPARLAAAGVMTGLTFLAHPAPAMLLGIVFAAETVRGIRVDRRPRATIASACARFALAAALVASPFLVSIVGHSHLIVRNSAPLTWTADELTHRHILHSLGGGVASLSVLLLALLGLTRLIGERSQVASRVVLTGAAAAAALFTATIIARVVPAVSHITLVPGHHFWVYLHAFEFLLGALGLTLVADRLSRIHRSAPILVAGLVIAAVAFQYRAYTRRADFANDPDAATKSAGIVELGTWIRTAVPADGVLLADDDTSLLASGASGRKVVAVDRFFSSPFVDWATRARDRDDMLGMLEGGDWVAFAPIAARYGVSHVLWRGPLRPVAALAPHLTPEVCIGDWCAYAVR